jgi:chromosome segregation ATPase
MVEEERAKKERVDECLEGVTNKIQEGNDRLKQAWKEISDWKDLWNRTLKERKGMREGFEARILNLTAILKESQTIASNERQRREEADRKLQNLSANWEILLMDLRNLKDHEEQQKRDLEVLEDRVRHLESQLHHVRELSSQDQTIIQEQYQEAAKWKAEFSNLAEFANNVVRGIPSMHKRASAVMFPNNTPIAVFNFVESCGIMLKEFKASLDAARKAKL